MATYHPIGHVEKRLSPQPMTVMGSAVHLSKTVMNIVSNAAEAEAMPAGARSTSGSTT